ncbi:predicted protein [Sclerotinia sclerotiorum 1980 UF-70]|uniref:Uncharacterized protein n=1 Tax=Sclerotinia sclerotiorum (strain ATCC 18683 / 1980 / Ss-1) TaxID=665079 RepID=A7EDS2_SCLS1|nr:predicted protein [Sclerotinia sclerotiorum 1980 UF-70]EDO00988.1 predicted protein [Sclerotinia sclerotiorum 1980 UF-70]
MDEWPVPPYNNLQTITNALVNYRVACCYTISDVIIMPPI